eukprot:1944163-Amphidinium_carterae.1
MNLVNSQFVAQKISKRVNLPHGIAGRVKKSILKHQDTHKSAVYPNTKRSLGGGHGGAYRAFLSLRYRGTKGRIDFSNIKDEYHQEQRANTELYQRCVQLGMVACDRKREDGVQGFGPTTRNLRRKTEHMSQTLLPLSQPDKSLALGAPTAVSGPEGMQVVLLQDIPGELKKVRATAKSEARSKRTEQQRDLHILETFDAGVGKQLLESVLQQFPELCPLQKHLKVIPHGFLKLVSMDFSDISIATSIAEWACKHSKNSNLRRALQDDWDRKNRVILEQAAGVDVAVPPLPKLCNQYACPSCCPSMKTKKRFRVAFLRLLKETFPRSVPDQKQALSEGHIVFKVVVEGADTPADTCWAQEIATMLGEDVDDAEQEHAPSPQWYHIALQYFKPYRPTCQKLLHVKTDGQGRHTLQQSFEYVQDVEIFKGIAEKHICNVQFFRMVMTVEPVVAYQPMQCVVELASEPIQLKPRVIRTRAARQVHEHELAADFQVSEDSSDGDEDMSQLDDLLAQMHDTFLDEQEERVATADGGGNESFPLFSSDMNSMIDLAESLDGFDADSEPDMEEAVAEDFTEKVEMPLPSGAASSSLGPVHTDQHALQSQVATTMPGRAAVSSIAGPRFTAEAVCFVQTTGKISFHLSKNAFEAVCNKHKNCVLTRVARPAKAGKTVSAAGRPLGFLTSWLLLAQILGAECSSKEEHWDKAKWRESLTEQKRKDARCLLASLPGGNLLAEHERVRADGEPEEPVSITGLA